MTLSLCNYTAYKRAAASAKTEPSPSVRLMPMLAAPLVVSVALADAAEPDADVDADPVALVPFSAAARFWKAVKFRAEVCTGLTANTMPAPQ